MSFHSHHHSAPFNWPRTWRYARDTESVTAAEAMVVSTDLYATEVGVDALRSGGNAVDAAVAVFFALAVVNPEAGNLGGGSFFVIRTSSGELHSLDARSTAPRGASGDMFLDAQGGVSENAVIGHLSVAVPGSVRGIWEIHQRFGRAPWRELVEPAVRLARGFVVRQRFLQAYTPRIVDDLRRFRASTRIFLPGGTPPRVGDVFRQGELVATLERIRDRGPEDFYEGATAEHIVGEIEQGGGILTLEDLVGYEAIWRDPVRFTYRGREVVSMPPPSSGGVTLAEISKLLECFQLGQLPWHGGDHLHLLAEAWKRAYADRNHYLADPDFRELPIGTLTSSAFASWRASEISLKQATPAVDVRPGVEAFANARAGGAGGMMSTAPREPEHTTHFSVVDPYGGAVSVTTTINSWFGSKVTVEGAGFLLNNDMDDFTARPGLPNQFGLVQGDANRIEPGKRMLSAMAPSIVLDGAGRLCMVLGSPGGSSIITTVFQVVSNVIDHGMTLTEAVHAPRVHHQNLPDQIFYEPAGLPEDVLTDLGGRGHKLFEREEMSGDVQAILVHPDGTLEGRSDPRRGGAAGGY
jgi:gamma-glutamyltranspeptidase/glutathione hydrolase